MRKNIIYILLLNILWELYSVYLPSSVCEICFIFIKNKKEKSNNHMYGMEFYGLLTGYWEKQFLLKFFLLKYTYIKLICIYSKFLREKKIIKSPVGEMDMNCCK